MKFSFSSVLRLKDGWQFDLVFRTGRRETGELVRLFFLEQPLESKMIGVAVGKKMANAPQRSRGRRILRESFRRLLPWIKDGVWIVGSLREKALDASAKDIYIDISTVLKKRNLMKEDWPGINWDVDSKQKNEKNCCFFD